MENNQNYVKKSYPRKHELLDLANNKELRDKYLAEINLDYFTQENLNKLQKEHSKNIKRKYKYDRSALRQAINEILKDFMPAVLSNYDGDILDDYEFDAMVSRNKINEFEKNLSYLLCLDVINPEEALKRGFSEEYIEKLLKETKVIIDNPNITEFEYPNVEKREVEFRVKQNNEEELEIKELKKLMRM